MTAITTLCLFGSKNVARADDPVSVHSHPFLSKNVKVSSWIENGTEVVVGQEVTAIIEIATQNWFTRGTQIADLELSDAIIPSGTPYAANLTRREADQTWSVQQLTFSIYPMKEKTYFIPAIPITLFIADDNGETISGQILNEPLWFEAVIPEDLKGISNWVVTSLMTVHEQYSGPLEGLQPGDAVIRQLEFQADAIPAMMLPTVSETTIQGLSVYQDPPKLTDTLNRGIRTGKRIEKITYYIEKNGNYQIPARKYVWWNTVADRLETILLPEQTISTTGPQNAGGFFHKVIGFRNEGPLIWTMLFFMAAAGAFIVFHRYLKRSISISSTEPPMTKMELQKCLKTAVKRRDHFLFLRLFYYWFDIYGLPNRQTALRRLLPEKKLMPALEDLDSFMAGLYGKTDATNAQDLQDVMERLMRLTRRRSFFNFFTRHGIQARNREFVHAFFDKINYS